MSRIAVVYGPIISFLIFIIVRDDWPAFFLSFEDYCRKICVYSITKLLIWIFQFHLVNIQLFLGKSERSLWLYSWEDLTVFNCIWRDSILWFSLRIPHVFLSHFLNISDKILFSDVDQLLFFYWYKIPFETLFWYNNLQV
jgi:hypothetical protein